MPLGRLLIVAGVALVAAGILLSLAGHLPFQLGRLPGDNPEVRIFLFTADADRKKVAEIRTVGTKLRST